MRRLILPLVSCSLACNDPMSRHAPFESVPLVAIEELRIGSPDDPEAAFTWFRDLEVATDGTIFTAHPQESQIRMHSADGEFLGTIGRKGEGPGEFDRVGQMAMVGDTLRVLDHGLYRISYFERSGQLLLSRNIPVNLGERRGDRPARPVGLFRDGTVRGAPPAFSNMIASGELTENVIVRLDTAGRTRDTIGTYSLLNTTWAIQNDEDGPAGFGSYRTQPFGDAEILDVSDYDMIAVRVRRGTPQSSEPPAFRVTAWRIDGDTIFSRDFSYEPIPLRTSMVDSIIDGFAESVASSEFLAGRATYEQAASWAREGLFVPPYHPPVSGLTIGADGTFWLRGEELGNPAVTWRILSASGEPIGSVELPAGLRVMYVREMKVWGMEFDDLDVPHIVRYVVGSGEG